MISTRETTSKPQTGKPASRNRGAPRDRSGFGFLIGACVLTCGLLVANGLIVSLAYPAIEQACGRATSLVPWLLSANRLSQILMLALPVLMIFGEWWLFDFVVDYVFRPWDRKPEDRRSS